MEQNTTHSQFIAKCIDRQNKKLLEQSKAKHGYWLNVFKNFCASTLVIACVGSAVIMGKGCTAESQSVERGVK